MSETQTIENKELNAIAGLAGKFLTFKLNNEEYGLDIMKVQEIIEILEVTPVPRLPDYVRGVVNLRNKVIPILELRTLFNMEPLEDSERTCIIVVELETATKRIKIGLIVEEVSEVLDIKATEISPSPNFGNKLKSDFISGIGNIDGEIKFLLDIEMILGTEQMDSVQSLAEPEITS